MLKNDFTVKKTDRVIKWIFLGIIIFITVGSLANWIATSFGTFDDDMQSIFAPAMDNKFWRGWSSYTVCDGYIAMVAYIIPGVILLYESLVIFSKKKKPNWWFARNAKTSYWVVFGFFIALYEIIILIVYWMFNWKDIGIGAGYNLEFITGKEYQIPEWVVSEVIANLVFFGIWWWTHYHVAKRPDFLELKIWRDLISLYLFLILNYIFCLILKWTMNRPYWYQIHWLDGYTGPDKLGGNPNWAMNMGLTDIKTPGGYQVKGALERLREWYPKQYDYYMHSDIWSGIVGKYSDGLKTLVPWSGTVIPASDPNWLWFKTTTRGTTLGTTQGALAFPSGHVVATAFCGFFVTQVMFKDPSSKSQRIWKWALASLGVIYELDMIFALQISSSHWWSDTTFGLFTIPFFVAGGWLISNVVFDKLNKHFNVENY